MLLTLWLIITLGLAARCIYLELKVSRQNTKEGTPSTSTNNARDETLRCNINNTNCRAFDRGCCLTDAGTCICQQRIASPVA